MLKAYLDAVGNGTPALDAARLAFGDLKAFDRAFQSHLHGLPHPGFHQLA